MKQPALFVDTAYGRLDRSALEKARNSYDTTCLLRTVDELAELLGVAMGEDGWHDQLLRLHRMAHTIINDAGFTGSEVMTLPELASEITGQLHEAVGRLQSWIQCIKPLAELVSHEE